MVQRVGKQDARDGTNSGGCAATIKWRVAAGERTGI
jgi:hypothetical protein